MGTVYKALHTKLGREVAIKVLPKSRLRDGNVKARFEREMRAIGALEHRNIVQAFDAREIEGTPVLVMELLDGLDLDTGRAPSADPCPWPMLAKSFVRRRWAAVAHEHGLVHRDVKPSNLMLTCAGEVKLLDLGLARAGSRGIAGEDLTGTGEALGTLDYMAPEQIMEKAVVDVRADIYSLGCTLFKLLTGHGPFTGPGCESHFEKMNAHLNKPPPQIRAQRSAVPPELAALIYRMMAKSPGERFATPRQVADKIGPLCSGADLAGLIGRLRAAPVPPPRKTEQQTEPSLPSSLTRVFQQFAVRKQAVPGKPSGGKKPWLQRTLPHVVALPIGALVLLSAAIFYRVQQPPGDQQPEKEVAAAKPATSCLVLDWPAAERKDVRVKVDNQEFENLGARRPAQNVTVPFPPGSHVLEIEREGYLTIQYPFELSDNQRRTYEPIFYRIKPESVSQPTPIPSASTAGNGDAVKPSEPSARRASSRTSSSTKRPVHQPSIAAATDDRAR